MNGIFDNLAEGGHELVALSSDPASGYRGVVAIHSTALGPAVGGTRWWTYRSENDAVVDALRLSRGMSYKNAMAGLPLGGGKAVILGPNDGADRRAVLRAHGNFVDRFGGRFITAEDVGTDPADMEFIGESTQYVAGRLGSSGDPSPRTARGVFRAIQAAVRFVWGADDIGGRTFAVQGVGNVGRQLVSQLADGGATVVVSDIDAERLAAVVALPGVTSVAASEIHRADADVFVPCALGAVLNAETIPEIRAKIVVGAANNQLAQSRHGYDLATKGILYVPDYVANAGGVCYGGAIEVLGVSTTEASARVEAIYDTTLGVLERGRMDDVPPFVAADRIAEERIRSGAIDAI